MQGIGGHRMDARGSRSDAGLPVVTNAFVEAACCYSILGDATLIPHSDVRYMQLASPVPHH